MNLKTGEIKFICNVGFGMGHVQTNPWNPGEIGFLLGDHARRRSARGPSCGRDRSAAAISGSSV